MIKLFKKAFKEWHRDKASQLAASITFYAMFALAPIMIIVIAVAGAFFGEQAVKGEIVGQIQTLVGPEIASAIQVIVENAHLSTSNILFSIISLLIFLFAASRIVTSLKYALNKIWDVKHKKHKVVPKYIKSKFLSMLAILGLGFIFALFLFTSGIMATIWVYLASFIPIRSSVFQILNLAVSFGLMTFIIALIYKYLPDIKIAWKDVWIGAAVTTVLFMLGNWAIGLYMRNVTIGSVYGAAGSLIIILLWLYYISQIFLFGAEFTKVHSEEKTSYFKRFFRNFLEFF